MADELKRLTDQFLQLQQQCWELTLSATPKPEAAAGDSTTPPAPDAIQKLFFDAHSQLLESLSTQRPGESPDSQFEATATQLRELLLKQWPIPDPLASAAQQSSATNHGNTGNEQPGLYQLALGDSAEIAQALTRFNQSLSSYLGHFEIINRHTLEKLETLIETSGKPDSILETESLWTECFEAAYRDQVFTSRYQQDYGELCNSYSHLSDCCHQHHSKLLSKFGAVSQSDFRKSLLKQHQQRKSMRRMQQQIQALRQQIDKLHQDHHQQIIEMRDERTALKAELAELKALIIERKH